jgi:hypothetical protein
MTQENKGFPRSLLEKPVAERYAYFESYSVAHTVLEDSFNRLLRTILLPAGKQLIFVIGPPGAGKTFLLEWIEDELKVRWEERQESDRGRIPVVSIEVPSKDRVKPSCGDVYERILKAMEEPLIDKKITYGDVTLCRDMGGRIAVGRKATISKLRYALEQALKHRRPFILSLDEAQHLLDIAGLSMEDVMDWIKSIANMTKVLIVLFGTYEMLGLLDLSDQLMRRSRVIHLRRYKDEGDDLNCFVSTVYAMQKNMPFAQEPNLEEHWKYLYGRTAGCVGNLYDWLLPAYHLALHDPGASTLTLKHLKACAPLTAQRADKMRQSIAEDERSFLEQIGEDDAEDFSFSAPPAPDENKKSERRVAGSRPGEKKGRKKRGRVGHRKPGRDSNRRERKPE